MTQTPLQGIDVSHYQGTIDWQKVAQAGIRFVFVKATQGITVVDPQFQTNWQEAKAAGLLRGAYHFFEPDDDPGQQAQNLLTALGGDPGEFPGARCRDPRRRRADPGGGPDVDLAGRGGAGADGDPLHQPGLLEEPRCAGPARPAAVDRGVRGERAEAAGGVDELGLLAVLAVGHGRGHPGRRGPRRVPGHPGGSPAARLRAEGQAASSRREEIGTPWRRLSSIGEVHSAVRSMSSRTARGASLLTRTV